MYKYRIACSGFNCEVPTFQNDSILPTIAVPMKTSTCTNAYTWILRITGSDTSLEERNYCIVQQQLEKLVVVDGEQPFRGMCYQSPKQVHIGLS